MFDSRGAITTDRTDLNEMKRTFASPRTDIKTLAEAMVGADVFLGLSKGGMVTAAMVRSMAENPIIFALRSTTS